MDENDNELSATILTSMEAAISRLRATGIKPDKGVRIGNLDTSTGIFLAALLHDEKYLPTLSVKIEETKRNVDFFIDSNEFTLTLLEKLTPLSTMIAGYLLGKSHGSRHVKSILERVMKSIEMSPQERAELEAEIMKERKIKIVKN